MRKILVLLVIPFFGFSQIGSIAEKTKNMELKKGFYDFYWDNSNGKIYLVVDKLNTPFLYVNSLPAGLGSNDIGLDRGQLGDSRIVYFNRVGKKIFLTQPNLDYRAVTNDKREQKAVEQSFAQSILFNFTIEAEEVNATDAADRDLTFGTGTGTATFTGAVGTTNNLGTIINASGQQLTFSDAVTATTIANYGTLLFNATSAKTITPAITDNGTTTVQVISNTDSNISLITFSGNIAADTITVGSSAKAGSALFNGTISGTNISVIGGDAASSAENSQATFANTVTVTAITLDNNTSTATVTFSGTAKTITGTINGAAAGEGTIVVSGTPTFASIIGGTNRIAQLTINGATTFQDAVSTTLLTTTAAISSGTTLNVSGASSIGANISTTGDQTYTGAVTLTASPTLTSPTGTILFSSTVDGGYTLTITNSASTGDVTFASAVGGTTSLAGLTITTDVLTAAAIKSTGTLK